MQSPSVFGPVSHTNQFIILSSEVWDTTSTGQTAWDGRIPQPNGFLSKTNSVTKMKVDYVRFYQGDIVPPANVSNLFVPNFGRTSLAVSWTAPGDDGTSGTATEYDLRYSTSSITDASFGSATRVTTGAPHVAGSSECLVVTPLSSCTTYYFAIKTRDEAGNWSGVSNVWPGTTQCSGNKAAKCGQGGAAQAPNPIDESSLSFSKPSPNPARGVTRFEISIPEIVRGQELRVEVFDVAGRRVRSLVDQTASPGQAQIEWNLLDNSGLRVASGLYRVRVAIGDTRKTFPLLVLR
jgi:hypothetical protein